MARQHSVTSTTTEKFLIDAGVVHMGYVDGSTPGTAIGVAKGSNTFTIETEYREMAFNGQKGKTKGARRIVKVSATLKVTFIAIDTALLLKALPGATAEDFPSVTPTHDQISRALQIALTDYIDSIVLIGEVNEPTRAPAIFGLKNVLNDGGFEIGLTDGEESTVGMTFSAHFDPAKMDEEPWFIRWPKEAV